MKFKSIAANFFHYVIDEEISVEFLFEDQNFVFDEDTIVSIETDNLIVLGQDYRVVSIEDCVGALRSDFSIQVPQILFDFENL